MAKKKRELDYEAEYAVILEAEEYYKSEHRLSKFVENAWGVLEPKKPYLDNFHIGLFCEHLEAISMGQLGSPGRLIVNMPPRYMKSTIGTVAWPCWSWIRWPEKRFVAASYSLALSLKHSTDRRSLIESAWYQRAWGRRFRLRDDQNTKSDFGNTRRGAMLATSVGGSSTGRGGDFLLIDDPTDPRRAASDNLRLEANQWFDHTFESRLDDKINGGIVLVMQRLHDQDLTGHLLARDEGWHHLKLEAEATKRTIYSFPLSGKEVIREEGDVLWPERQDRDALEKAKKTMGPQFGAQMQQDPTPLGGGFFQRSWWNRYTALPAKWNRKLLLIDCAEEPGITNDYTVFSTILETDNAFYWKDVTRERYDFPNLYSKTLDLILAEKPDAVIIEKKSAGRQLIQTLAAKTKAPVEAFEPGRDSKIVRASAAQPTVKSGICYLPEHAVWVEDFLKEHEKFPRAEHDDQVDTTSMLVLWVRENTGQTPEPNVRML